MENIGNYRILRLIGEGGMASVYEAEHAVLGRKAAIKVLNPVLSANEAIRERFRNEARVMASLEHPNITRVLEFDDQPQRLSIVMEFLEGEDMNRRIRGRGPLKETELMSVFRQVLSALQYAHDMGVVHRDIKPSNIHLMPDGQVKILDFGIAKVYGEGGDLTHTGQQIGTPVYMSPEQVKADKTIDHRTDIYSLGVTMYFALCGNPPYDASKESHYVIFNKIVLEPVPDSAGGARLNAIIQRACAKDRSHRFRDCREFQESLGRDPVQHVPEVDTVAQIRQNPEVVSDSPVAGEKSAVKGHAFDEKTSSIPFLIEGLSMNKSPVRPTVEVDADPRSVKRVSLSVLGLVLFMILTPMLVIRTCEEANMEVVRHDDIDSIASLIRETVDTMQDVSDVSGESVTLALPGGFSLMASKGGIEEQLLACIDDVACLPRNDQWFDFDDISFETGGADIRADSRRQIENLAAILKAFPKVKIKIGAFTDKAGDRSAELRLTQARAEAVTVALIKAGAAADRFEKAEGYGSLFAIVPASDGEERRMSDRRISLSLRGK